MECLIINLIWYIICIHCFAILLLIMILKTRPVSFLKKIYFWKNHYIFILVVSERYVLVLDLIYLSVLFLKYLRIKRTHLSLEMWIVRKYNLYAIIYDSNLVRCFQNSGDGLSFFSLDPSEVDARKVDPLTVLILIGYLMLLGDLEFRKIKSFKSADLRIHLNIISREQESIKKNYSS